MIKAKKKLCDNCSTEQFIWKNDKGSRYCKSCWLKYKSSETIPLKKRKYINPVSKKTQVLNDAYKPIRRDFILSNSICQAALPGCTSYATDVHHKKGRGKYMLAMKTWLSVCRQCHIWIELNPNEAIELGFSEKRY